MKKIFLTSMVMIAALVFVSCEKSDDVLTGTDPETGNGTGTEPENPVTTQDMEAALTALYPDASGVSWTTNGTYHVADFTRSTTNVGAEAWFETASQWQMTVTDVTYNSIPQAVKDAFEASQYATWRIDDVDMVERTGLETIYVLEVESGNLEYELYYSAEGILVKAVEDTNGRDDSSNYVPETISTTIESYITMNYPSARIVEIDREYNGIEVDIIDNGVHRELTFSNGEVWQMTVSELRYNTLPQAVTAAFEAGEYSTWRVEDADMVERSGMETVYVLEVESGNNEADLYYSADGTLVRVIADVDNDNDYENGNGSSNYVPGEITAAMESYIAANYPNARIVEIDWENNEVEIDIIDGTTHRELNFSTAGQWQYTKTEVRRNALPQVILAAFNASSYARYQMDDIDFYNTATEDFYIIELDAEPNDINLKVSTTGVIEVVNSNYMS